MSQEAVTTEVLLRTYRCPCWPGHGPGRGYRVGKRQLVQGSGVLLGSRSYIMCKGEREESLEGWACGGNGDPPGNGTGSLGRLIREGGVCGQKVECNGKRGLCVLFCFFEMESLM